MRARRNILHLGVKELRSLSRDTMMLIIIVFAFTVTVYTAATAVSETINKAPIAIIDEDRSQLSGRIVSAIYPPWFLPAMVGSPDAADIAMDAGRYTFSLYIPSGFQRDVLAGRDPGIQLVVDATRMSQAFAGSGHLQAVIAQEVNAFARRHGEAAPVDLVLRARFNPELDASWFIAMMQVIDRVTLLAIILTGAALLREREHGTIEHLLVMPVTPFEIMAAKVWSMGLVVFVAAALSLTFVVEGLLDVPVAGSIGLFLAGAALHLFACTALGILLGTVARSMPQFGLLLILVLLPLQMLSGGATPRENMPDAVQLVMLAAPTTHYIMLGQAILFRGAGLAAVWPQFAALAVIGASLFGISLAQFRKSMATIG